MRSITDPRRANRATTSPSDSAETALKAARSTVQHSAAQCSTTVSSQIKGRPLVRRRAASARRNAFHAPRPDTSRTARSAVAGRGGPQPRGATRSAARCSFGELSVPVREHGEHGEDRTLPAASTVRSHPGGVVRGPRHVNGCWVFSGRWGARGLRGVWMGRSGSWSPSLPVQRAPAGRVPPEAGGPAGDRVPLAGGAVTPPGKSDFRTCGSPTDLLVDGFSSLVSEPILSFLDRLAVVVQASGHNQGCAPGPRDGHNLQLLKQQPIGDPATIRLVLK